MSIADRIQSVPSIAIIGGGAAGMGCALWLKQMALAPVIIEKSAELGGQARAIDRINRWFLGHPGLTSQALATVFSEHIQHENIDVLFQSRIVGLERRDPKRIDIDLTRCDGTPQQLSVNAVVIAVGIKVRAYEAFCHAPGVDALEQSKRVHFFPTDHLAMLDQLRGQTIAVVGGSDNAHFTTADVADYASNVHLIMRSQPRAQQQIRNTVEALIEAEHVTEHQQTEIIQFDVEDGKLGLTLVNAAGARITITVDRLLVRAGFVPALPPIDQMTLLQGLQTNSAGYIETDRQARTSISRVYAIGDITGLSPPSLITAAAQGAVAARAIEEDLGSQKPL